jgi:hypothetical protein
VQLLSHGLDSGGKDVAGADEALKKLPSPRELAASLARVWPAL